MTRRFRSLVKAFAALAVVVLFAVACSSDGFPVSFDDQIDEETGLSNVELNWRDGCEPSLSEDLADKATQICECSFSRIRTTVDFDAFVEVNGRFADNPEILTELSADGNAAAAQIVDLVKACIAES